MKISNFILIAAALSIFSTSSFAGEKEDLIGIQTQQANALRSKNIQLYMKRYADDFKGTTPQKIEVNRAQVEQNTKVFLSRVKGFVKVDFITKDVKLAGSKARIKVRHLVSVKVESPDGKSIVKIFDSEFDQDWAKRKGQWLLTSAYRYKSEIR